MTKIGGLFEGYGGLTMAARAAFGGELAWVSEYEPPSKATPRPTQAAARLLAHHHPDVPNLGDITAIDWPSVEPVDVLCLGFPCQDVSSAGKRAGMKPGTRSGLWAHSARAIAVLRPYLVVIENVRGLLSAEAACDVEPCPWCLGDDSGRPLRALGAVLGDLAVLGYDARWCGVRASDAGAPHERFRVFVLAWPAADTDPSGRVEHGGTLAVRAQHGAAQRRGCVAPDPECVRRGPGRPAEPGEAAGGQPRGDAPRRHEHAAAHAHGGRLGPDEPYDAAREPDAGGGAAADATRDGRREGRPEPAGLVGRPDAPERGARPAPDPDCAELRDEPRRGGGPSRSGAGVAGDDGAHRRAVADATSGGDQDEPISGDPERLTVGPVARAGDGDRARRAAEGVHELGRAASELAWGPYEPAVRRWEQRLGRPAPAPTQTGKRGGQQLSPKFVEWLMGLPEGWVTDVPGLTRNEQLKLLGNGVVPQQAELALHLLLLTPVLREDAA